MDMIWYNHKFIQIYIVTNGFCVESFIMRNQPAFIHAYFPVDHVPEYIFISDGEPDSQITCFGKTDLYSNSSDYI